MLDRLITEREAREVRLVVKAYDSDGTQPTTTTTQRDIRWMSLFSALLRMNIM